MNTTNGRQEQQDPVIVKNSLIYDKGTIKVVAFACVVIVLAVVLTGSISYYITRSEVVEKLKTRDLVYITESISAKIDGRIERAKETSVLLAKDPAIIEWVAGEEKDERLGQYAKTKINDLANNYDYANSFIVSAVTNHYWAEGFKLIQIMSKTDPDSQWFYDALQSRTPVFLNIDFNSGRQDTFVFLDALMGDVEHPIAVTGVGLSLSEIAGEFQRYKFGEQSNLWLVDGKGKIHLSDTLSHNGSYLSSFVPQGVFQQVVEAQASTSVSPQILEYTNEHGETIDMAYQNLKSTDWKIVFQIPRRESISLLGNVKFNTAAAGLITLVLMTFVFYTISRRIADPLQRALLITAAMEKQVSDRTRELAEQNQKVMDSIDYAKRLQEAILPAAEELQAVFQDYFVLWQPRDVVGGDCYWVRRLNERESYLAVLDCTGHGVPGAFMTMAVNTVLNHLVDQGYREPDSLLAELNRQIKGMLHRNDQQQVMTDDGLDIALCRIEENRRLIFAGAKMALAIKRGHEVTLIKGENRSIGYRRSRNNLSFTGHSWEVEPGDCFYITTDGFLDQNGGDKDLPYGRKNFIRSIAAHSHQEMGIQGQALAAELAAYMGTEPQRADITVLGFTLKS